MPLRKLAIMHGGFINPEKVVAQLDLKPGMKVADFGCGHGYFTLPAARIVGYEGRVYAVDVLPEALEAVRSLTQLANVFNIETIRGNLEKIDGSNLPAGCVDLVLLHNVLFEAQEKDAVIKECERVLKPGGILALADWRLKSSVVVGPPVERRLSEQEARSLAEAAGFIYNGYFDTGEYHYGLMFIKL